jgi:flagellar hook-basal body complex protein FliE
MASPLSAANAYAAMQKAAGGGTGLGALKPPSLEQNGGGTGVFAGMVQQFVSGTVDSARKSEGAMTQAIAGKADMVDVVTAVAESEAALETLVAVRDRVISAYEEIMRMPI